MRREVVVEGVSVDLRRFYAASPGKRVDPLRGARIIDDGHALLADSVDVLADINRALALVEIAPLVGGRHLVKGLVSEAMLLHVVGNVHARLSNPSSRRVLPDKTLPPRRCI